MKKVFIAGLIAVALVGCDRAKQSPTPSPSATPVSSPEPDGSDLDAAILGTASPTPQTPVSSPSPEPVESQPIEQEPILTRVDEPARVEPISGSLTGTIYPDCRFKGAWVRQSTSTKSPKVGWIACTQQVQISPVNRDWYAYGNLGYLHRSTLVIR